MSCNTTIEIKPITQKIVLIHNFLVYVSQLINIFYDIYGLFRFENALFLDLNILNLATRETGYFV